MTSPDDQFDEDMDCIWDLSEQLLAVLPALDPAEARDWILAQLGMKHLAPPELVYNYKPWYSTPERHT